MICENFKKFSCQTQKNDLIYQNSKLIEHFLPNTLSMSQAHHHFSTRKPVWNMPQGKILEIHNSINISLKRSPLYPQLYWSLPSTGDNHCNHCIYDTQKVQVPFMPLNWNCIKIIPFNCAFIKVHSILKPQVVP